MHVFVGFLLTVFAFVGSRWAEGALPYQGLLNPPAMVLLLLGPIGVAMVSHPFSEWRINLDVLGRAFRHDRAGSLLRASEEMTQIARAVRETRWGDAETTLARARSEQVRNLAPYLLARLEPEALHEALANVAFRWMAEVKATDDFLQSLARSSPAFGMIGTIMGLVALFANMRDSASLGPGMAMALLATLYGLILCYCLYMPLSQRVRSYLTSGAQEQRAVERAIHLTLEGRPIGEVRESLIDASEPTSKGVISAPAEVGGR